MKNASRRGFLGGLAATSALTIVPRRVLGGRGYLAPSDMILLAQVGCGMQGQRQVNTGFVARKDLQFVAVVDPNRDSQDQPVDPPLRRLAGLDLAGIPLARKRGRGSPHAQLA